MSDESPRLGLPYIAPAQAQKHVTHNEALQRLDALTQMSFVQVGADNAPADPQDGDLFAIGDAPSGIWSGYAGQIAYRAQSAWVYLEPRAGWRAWDQLTGTALTYVGGAWQAEGFGTQNLSGVGVGTTSDPTNRLSVSSDATLLSHAGGGHQLKVNKATNGDVASLLYQSNWAGHAEMGLTGDIDFHIKVSADGSGWTDAMVFDAGTGLVRGAAIQSAPDDVTPGRLATTEGSYGPGSVLGSVGLAGGLPTGAVIERQTNANGTFVRWADGTQMCWVSGWSFDEEANGTMLGGGTWTYPAAFYDAPTVIPSFGNSVGTHWIGTNTHRRVSCFGCETSATSATMMRIFSAEMTPFSTGAQATQVHLLAVGNWA